MSGECDNCGNHCLDCNCQEGSDDLESSILDQILSSIRSLERRFLELESFVRTDAILLRFRKLIDALEQKEHTTKDNARRLDEAIKELRGLTAMIRPGAAKNPWFKKEIPGVIAEEVRELE